MTVLQAGKLKVEHPPHFQYKNSPSFLESFIPSPLKPPHSCHAGGAQGAGRWHSWPSWPQGYSTSYGICSLYKDGEGEERRGIFGIMAFVFPSLFSQSPALLGMAEYLLPMGSDEFIVYLCLHGQLFLYLLNCPHLNPQVLSFYSSISLPSPTAGHWGRSCVRLSCQLGLNHNVFPL